MGIKTGTPTTEANGGKATPGGNSGTGEVPTAPTGPTQAETDAAQNATSQSTQFVSGSGARLGDGQLTPNRGFDAGSSTDAGSSQGASQDDDWRNAPPMGVTADNRIEPNQVLDEATRQVEGDWEFYDRAGEVIFFVATTVFTGGAAWFGRGAVVGKTGATATAAGGAARGAWKYVCFVEGTQILTQDGVKDSAAQLAKYLEGFAATATPTTTQSGARIWRRGPRFSFIVQEAPEEPILLRIRRRPLKDTCSASLSITADSHSKKWWTSMRTSVEEIVLNGSESAILVGALFALGSSKTGSGQKATKERLKARRSRACWRTSTCTMSTTCGSDSGESETLTVR